MNYADSTASSSFRKKVDRPYPAVPERYGFKDLTGYTTGRLTVVKYMGSFRRQSHWLCRCSCGRFSVRQAGVIMRRKNQSCGCLHKEQAAAAKHTHGMSRRPEYKVFSTIVQRCHPTRGWKNYGLRGIECRFDSFEQFYDEIGDRPGKGYDVDRIDNNGHYEPGNVQWLLRKPNTRKTRRTRWITAFGETKAMSEWAEELDICPTSVLKRLRLGWCSECAVGAPRGSTCVHR